MAIREQKLGPNESKSHRPDIDGLRSIAVLSVILFHLDKALIPGGFVGVDIFFVISGYLITAHIVQDLDRGRFSIAAFYGRRIKRIAPALFIVVGLTIFAAKALMLPEDAAETAKSGVWALASLANVFFWRYQDTGYFAAQDRDLPLLHLWSLGVEEQFYIVWPLLLAACRRSTRGPGALVAMIIVSAISFALGDLLFASDPSFVYYMLPTRAGELLIGAMATTSVVRTTTERLSARARNVLAALGLVLLILSLATLTESDVFPGWRAIAPTAGAGLLILTGSRDDVLVARLLSIRVMTTIGLISYSAYLWHWPLLTFFRYGYGDAGPLAGTALFASTMLCAGLSYRFVEQPVRRIEAPFSRLLVGQFILPATAIGAFAVALIYCDRIYPALTRTAYRQQLAALRADSRPAYEYPYVCQRQRVTEADLTDKACVLGASSPDEPTTLLWGDSNAAHYIGILAAFARRTRFRFRNIEVGSCPPLFSDVTPFVEARRRADCISSEELIRPHLDRASTVIVSAAYTEYRDKSRDFIPAFEATVRQLAAVGKHVVVLGKAPILAGFDRRCREKALAFPFLHCSTITAPLAPSVKDVNDELRDFAVHTAGVAYFDANAYLCANGDCSSAAPDGTMLYYDPSHFSLTGSWKVGEAIYLADGVPPPFVGIP